MEAEDNEFQRARLARMAENRAKLAENALLWASVEPRITDGHSTNRP